MPADALPQPLVPASPLTGALRLVRAYSDALGRPMTGQVVITGAQRAQDGDQIIVAAPVVAPVVAGVLDVELPAGTYTLAAALATADGNRVDDAETVTLTAS